MSLLACVDARLLLLQARNSNDLGMYSLQRARRAIEQHLDAVHEADSWMGITFDFEGLPGASLANFVRERVCIGKIERDDTRGVLPWKAIKDTGYFITAGIC